MRRGSRLRRSIYLEMAALLLLSAAVAVLFYLGVDRVTDQILASYIERTGHAQNQSRRYAKDLQEFVNENEVSYAEIGRVREWTQSYPVVMLLIYDDEHLIFDSMNGPHASGQVDREDVPLGYYHKLHLTDRTVEIYLYGNFAYMIYNSLLIAEIILSFLLFLAIFLFGIRRKIQYIRRLRQEVEVLEGGGLRYPITVLGKDELADLASGLEAMRRSFLRQSEEAERLAQANRTMVTQISHDLRTPLTAIMLYAELMQSNPALSEEQRNIYLSKISKKVQYLRDLSERLVTYAAPEPVRELPQPRPAREVFYDGLSDLCAYLEEQGFALRVSMRWEEAAVSVEDEELSRILDNLASNLLRYAERTRPVLLTAGPEGASFCLRLRNTAARTQPVPESRQIGLQSVESMMRRMQGSCRVQREGDNFEVCLSFPLQGNLN